LKIKGIHSAPALIIVVSAMMLVAEHIDISKISANTNPYLTFIILQLICLGLPAAFFCLMKGKDYKSGLFISAPKASHFTFAAYAFLFIVSASIALSLVMYTLFPESFAGSSMDVQNSKIASFGTNDSIYAAIAFAIIPAILEEFLFRGIVRAEYSKYGTAASVIMPALLFALLHFSPVRLPIYLFSGIILGITANATQSIFPSMLIHVANNLFVLNFENYIYKIAAKHSGGIIILTFIVVSVMLISAILFFRRAENIYYDYGVKNRPSPLVKKVKKTDPPLVCQAFFSPTLLVLLIFYSIVSFVL